jgi:hypothetical protein
MALHRMVPLVAVLQRSAPGMVYPHRIVGGNRPIQKRPALLARVSLPQLFKSIDLLPPIENPMLNLNMLTLGIYLVKHPKVSCLRAYRSYRSVANKKAFPSLLLRKALVKPNIAFSEQLGLALYNDNNTGDFYPPDLIVCYYAAHKAKTAKLINY